MQRWRRGVCQFQQEGQGITHQVVRNRAGEGGISHPACERLSQVPEGLDGAVPWGSDTVSEELSGLTKDVGALWAMDGR